MTPPRVRFAPSPTGFLHVGGLRTALYNYLLARKHGGTFILRIEDTDQSRKVEGAVENLIRTLAWAGIEYDEGPEKNGPAAPYVQSQRLALYKEHAERLIATDKAYYCFCTPERLQELREKQNALKVASTYDKKCLEIPKDEASRRAHTGERCVVRMKVPSGGQVVFQDKIRGEISIAHEMIDDQVILKSDGYPTYHLAVVVDDHLMGVTHVIRGEEWLPSTPKHVLLYQYFGWDLPLFAHLPLLLNPDKSKLSKRQGDVAVESYREQGYLPEAMVNFIALLGWNPGDDREIFSMDELIRDFSLERVGKSGAVFNVEKLQWLNAQHLRKQPDAVIFASVRASLDAAGLRSDAFSDAYLGGVVSAMRERMTFTKDIVEKSRYFFEAPKTYDEATRAKRWKPESAGYLKNYIDEISTLSTFSKEDFDTALNRAAQRSGVGRGDLVHPVRLAVTGVGAGPGLFETLAVLGKDEAIKRLNNALVILK